MITEIAFLSYFLNVQEGDDPTIAVAARLYMKVKNLYQRKALNDKYKYKENVVTNTCAKDEQLTSIEGADMGEHIHPEKYRLKD